MHQFQIDPILGQLGSNNPFAFTNSALWMLIVLACIYGFMMMGMKRQLVPGRGQVAFEFKDANSQAQLRPVSDGSCDYKYVVMPMRL